MVHLARNQLNQLGYQIQWDAVSTAAAGSFALQLTAEITFIHNDGPGGLPAGGMDGQFLGRASGAPAWVAAPGAAGPARTAIYTRDFPRNTRISGNQLGSTVARAFRDFIEANPWGKILVHAGYSTRTSYNTGIFRWNGETPDWSTGVNLVADFSGNYGIIADLRVYVTTSTAQLDIADHDGTFTTSNARVRLFRLTFTGLSF